MDRRTFMKLMGGLASMPVIGRIAKPLKSETVQEGIAAVSDKGMELYEMVVAKVMKEGKKIGESGRVDSYKHPDRPDITVDVNQTDGSAEIYFDTDKGSKGYAKIDRDMETGGTDLQEAEEIFNIRGDKDIEEGISGGLENLDEFTRIKKSIGGRVRPADRVYDPRANVEDFTKALKSVSAGTTYQQQRQAQDYARQDASRRLSEATRSGNQANIQGIFQGVGGITSIPGMQFNRSGNRVTSIPATGPGRDAIINAMAQQMLNYTPSYQSLKPQPRDNLGLLMQDTIITDQMKSPAEMEAIRQKVLEAQKAQEQSYFMTDPVTGKKYSTEAQAIDDLGLVTYNQRFADGGAVDLTIITMPDISGSGVESLFKTR